MPARPLPASTVPRLVALALSLACLATGLDARAQGPTLSLAGRVLRADTGEPLRFVTVECLGPTPVTTTSSASGEFQCLPKAPGTYTIRVPAEGFKQTSAGPFAVVEGKPAKVEVKVAPQPPSLAAFVYNEAAAPGENIVVQVRSRRVRMLDVTVQRLAPEMLKASLSKALDVKRMKFDDKPVFRFQQPVGGGESVALRTSEVRPAFDQPGLYVFRIKAADAKLREVRVPVFVTKLGLVVKRGRDDLVLWAADRESARAFPDVQFQVDPAVEPSFAKSVTATVGGAKVDDRGLARLKVAGGKPLRVWAFAGEHAAYVTIPPAGGTSEDAWRVFVTTDRHVYRPGHLLHWKATVRADQGGGYRIKPNEAFVAELVGPHGQVAGTQQGTTNAFGSLSGAFRLDEEADLGDWSVRVRRPGQEPKIDRGTVAPLVPPPDGEEDGPQGSDDDGPGDEPSDGAPTLDGYAGSRGLGVVHVMVSAYRKPAIRLEVSAPRAHFLMGEEVVFEVRGAYSFGAPAANLEVNYTVLALDRRAFVPGFFGGSMPWERDDGYDSYRYGRTDDYGKVKLDADGKATVRVPAARGARDRELTLEAEATDATGQRVSAEARVDVLRADLRLQVSLGATIAKVNEAVPLMAKLTRVTGEAATGAEVKATTSVRAWDAAHKMWAFRKLASVTAKTDANGGVKVPLKVGVDGLVYVAVESKDAAGRPVVEETAFWSSTDDGIGGVETPRYLEATFDKPSYRPGDKARLLVSSKDKGGLVLLGVEGDHVFQTRTVKMSSQMRYLEIPITEAMVPTLYVTLAQPKKRHVHLWQSAVTIQSKAHALRVEVSSNKQAYLPGERAAFTLQVKDAEGKAPRDKGGKPVPVELSVALVDRALELVAPDHRPHIDSYFWASRPNPIVTVHAFVERMVGGASKDSGRGVRRDFRDMAHWNAHVVTDADGKAMFTAKLPDDLATWRLLVRAASGGDGTLRAGEASHDIVAKKPFVVRLGLPRFMTAGDTIDVVAVAQNLTEQAGEAEVALAIEKGSTGTLVGEPVRKVKLGPMAAEPVRFAVQAATAGTLAVLASAQMGSSAGTMKDAEARKVPVHPMAVKTTARLGGLFTNGQSVRVELPEALAGKADVRLDASGTPLPLLEEAVAGLVSYPYGCTEQTVSAFVPAVTVASAYDSLGIARPKSLARLPRWVERGVRRLYSLASPSGGWGWWSGEEADPYLTAYALMGLDRAKGAGFAVSDEVRKSGRDALLRGLPDLKGLEGRAFLALALSPNKDDADLVKAEIAKVAAAKGDLSTFAWAAALEAATRADDKASAPKLAERLAASLETKGDVAQARQRQDAFEFTDGATDATARALRALVRHDPKHPLLVPLAKGLLHKARGDGWDSTRDTASAIDALVALALAGGGGGKGQLTLDGAAKATLAVDPATRASHRASVADVGPSTLTYRGEGAAFVLGEVAYLRTAVERNEGCKVDRTWGRITHVEDEATGQTEDKRVPIGGHVTPGEEIDVQIVVTCPRSMRYLFIEDPRAAGFEVDARGTSGNVGHLEVRDERVALFVSTLNDGRAEVHYRMRAEMTGRIGVPPAIAMGMYAPWVRGNSAPMTWTVRR